MFDAERLLSELIGGQFTGRGSSRKRYRHHGGGLGGSLGRAALSPQGLTILGGLAIAAYDHLKEKRTGNAGGPGAPVLPGNHTGTPGSAPVPAPPPFPGSSGPAPVPATGTTEASARALLLIEAMVHAAKADGMVDGAERERILAHLDKSGAGPEARAHLEALFAGATSLESIVSRVNDPQLAAEVYAASLLTIDPDTPAEEAYLATLAARLQLDPRVTQAIAARLDARGEETQA